jgi:hypothetical protein
LFPALWPETIAAQPREPATEVGPAPELIGDLVTGPLRSHAFLRRRPTYLPGL